MKIQRLDNQLMITAHGDNRGDPDWWKDPTISIVTYMDLDSKLSWMATRTTPNPIVKNWVNPTTGVVTLRAVCSWDVQGYDRRGEFFDYSTSFPVNKHVYTDKEAAIFNRRNTP
jgi:hypothetical protein